MKVIHPTHQQRVKTPRRSVTHQAEDGANIVSQYDLNEVACVHQASALEYLLILGITSSLIAVRWTLELPILVDGKDLFRHVLSRTLK